MYARLVLAKTGGAEPPVSPTLVIDNNGTLALYSSGWSQAVKWGTLASLIMSDIAAALPYANADEIILSDIRQLPTSDLASVEFLTWAENWWSEASAELARVPLIAR